ncbi:MAG: CGNR zinc finger domain-containing protein [Gemmatimonadaceae bacterium]
MPADPVQERFAPDAPFRFVSGDPSLDFVNTADWTPRGLERDRFTAYERLLEWARSAALVGPAEARRLGHTAVRQPRRAALALDAARYAREVLREVFASVVSGRPSAKALEKLNALLADAATHMCIVRGRAGRLGRGWAALGESPESLLWPVVWAAADFVASRDIEKLRMCAGHDCGWLYVDRSRNGLRRWCEMSVCGTAEKNRRRARR